MALPFIQKLLNKRQSKTGIPKAEAPRDDIQRAKALRKEGYFDEAEALLSPYIVKKNGRALQEHAHISFDKYDTDQSVIRWHAALQVNQNAYSRLYLSRAHRRKGEFDRALEVTEAGLQEASDAPLFVVEKKKILAKDTGLTPFPAFKDNIAKDYLALRKEKEIWQKENIAIADFIAPLQVASVLDIPFGTGRLVPFFKQKRLHITGVDISQDMLREAQKSLGDDFTLCNAQTGSVTAIPFPHNNFDLSVCLRLISNNICYGMVEPALEELHRVTSKYLILDLKSAPDHCNGIIPPRETDKMDARLKQQEVEQLLHSKGFSITNQQLIYRRGIQQKYLYLLKKN